MFGLLFSHPRGMRQQWWARAAFEGNIAQWQSLDAAARCELVTLPLCDLDIFRILPVIGSGQDHYEEDIRSILVLK